MAVTFQAEKVKFPDIKKRKISNWISAVAESYGKFIGEIGYLFCDDERIIEVNRKYLKHDYYTDIITFDYSEGDMISGDIFISLDTVKSNSQKYNTEFQEELYRIIIHGILHLCGLDDSNDGEKKKMRAAEERALKLLKPED